MVVATLVALGLARGERAGEQPGERRPAAAREEAATTLPGGARELLPRHRVVTYFGAPQAPELGTLGIGTPDEAAARLARQARAYAGPRRRPVLPALHLVVTIAASAPGDDGLYRIRQDRATVRRYLAAARRAGALLVLDIQPGQAALMDEVRALDPFLADPHVSLAIDPEWAMGPGEVPGSRIGSVDAAEINRVAAHLGRVVRRRALPEKLLIVHQFTEAMITRRGGLRAPPGVDLVVLMDGVGSPDLKRDTYRQITRQPGAWGWGFKLFYEEDGDLMSPLEVLALRPRAEVVVYE